MPRLALIPDDDKFPALWDGLLTVAQIGAFYGVSAKVVSAKACRDGLPPREKFREAARQKARARRAPKNDRPADRQNADPAEAQLNRLARAREKGRITTPPFWTFERDSVIVLSAGSYETLNTLAKRWSVPMARVMARWHIVRGT